MGRLIFILGGARSGKSGYAQELAKAEAERFGKGVLYVATATARDEEMARRVAHHRHSRPSGWRTVEEPHRVSRVIQGVDADSGALIVDCLTLLLSNILFDQRVGHPRVEGREQEKEQAVMEEIERILQAARGCPATVILVSNEVGQGVVPPTAAGRLFRDVAGRIHQRIAREAQEVYFLIAGLPQRLK